MNPSQVVNDGDLVTCPFRHTLATKCDPHTLDCQPNVLKQISNCPARPSGP